MCLVALLIMVDVLILTAWYFTDPIRCSRSVGAVVKVQFIRGFVGLLKQVVKQDLFPLRCKLLHPSTLL